MNVNVSQTTQTKNIAAWVILFIAAVNGLIYVFIVPPWQHNDEPGNFEYVWLFANAPELLQKGLYDQTMRREMAASMVEHTFFSKLEVNPNLLGINQEIWIGLPQYTFLQDSGLLTLYFRLASIPLRLVRFTDITYQLYGTRFFSYCLFLLTIGISIQASKILINNDKVAMLIPLTMALFPNFVDKMTAVNDDVGAVFAMSLFLWISVTVLKKGLTSLRLLGLILSMLLCLYIKRNVWPALPFGILTLYLLLWRRKAYLGWISALIIGVIIFVSSFSPSESIPANFYSLTNQALTIRERTSTAVAGKYSFRFSNPMQILYQPLSDQKIESAKGLPMTLGLWLWGNEPMTISSPQIQVDNKNILPQQQIKLNSQPTFYAFTVDIPLNVEKIAFALQIPELSAGKTVYGDCIILIHKKEDLFPPQPLDSNCSSIRWGEQEENNLIKNASAENGWLTLRENFSKWMDKYFSYSITNIWAIFDADVGFPYLQTAGKFFFESFWGRFGWGAIELTGGSPFIVFQILTILAIIGNILALWQERKNIPWSIVLYLILVSIVIVFMGLFRTAGNWVRYEAMPNARYLLPVFLPIVSFLVMGFYQIYKSIKPFPISPLYLLILYIILLICYNGWAWFSIWHFIHS